MNTSWFSVGRRFLQTPAKTSRSLTSFGRRGKKGMLSRVFINVKYIPSISHCLKAWALLSPDIRNYNWPIPSWPSALCVHKVSNWYAVCMHNVTAWICIYICMYTCFQQVNCKGNAFTCLWVSMSCLLHSQFLREIVKSIAFTHLCELACNVFFILNS